MTKSLKITILLAIIGLGVGCLKREQFSEIPELSYNAHYFQDSLLYLVFTFKDGDGNVGLKEGEDGPLIIDGDTVYVRGVKIDPASNLFMEYFGKNAGEWTYHTLFQYRMPFIEPEGKNKALEGEMTVEIFRPFTNSLPYDTIKFVCQFYDRANNKSNVVETEEIIRP